MATRKHKCKVGDVLAIPLEGGEFAFGRVINLGASWELVEILSVTADSDSPDASVLASEALYPPITFHLREVEAGRVKTVARDPDYVPGYIERLRFSTGYPGAHAVTRVNQYRPDAKISDAQAERLPKKAYYAPAGTAKAVRAILDSRKTVKDWLAE
jgi:hypothetical protein